MQIGDLVRFKLDQRFSHPVYHYRDEAAYRARYPYKYEIGMVVPGLYKSETYISFPSRPKPNTYVLDCLEVISAAR
jgi:hypothetical protein